MILLNWILQVWVSANIQPPTLRVDAFALMMSSQKQLSKPSLPPHLTEHNKKDKLHNSILDFFKRNKCCFRLTRFTLQEKFIRLFMGS